VFFSAKYISVFEMMNDLNSSFAAMLIGSLIIYLHPDLWLIVFSLLLTLNQI